MLDDLDCVGKAFVRYADNATVYVSSERAGQRVIASISDYIARLLKLKVNRQKSAVDRAKQPFSGVEQMRQRILDRATTARSVAVVRIAISRPIERKVLTRDSNELPGTTKASGK